MTRPEQYDLPERLFTRLEHCWICGGKALVPATDGKLDLERLAVDPVLRDYVGYRFQIQRCKSCKFMQPTAIPARSEYFDSLYNMQWSEEWMETDFSCTYKDAIFQGILQELAKRLPEGRRRLLDVGCHVGRMPYLAHRAGWQAEGIELNPRTSDFAVRRTGLPIHRRNARTLANEGVRYDAVLMTDVLEHIPNPLTLLKELRTLLSPGGVLAIKVPCGANQLLKQRIRHAMNRGEDAGIGTNYVHVNHFGPQSLALAMRKAGLEAVRIGIGAPELSPGSGVRGAIDRGIRSAVYLAGRLIPFGVQTPLALNLQAFGTAPINEPKCEQQPNGAGTQ